MPSWFAKVLELLLRPIYQPNKTARLLARLHTQETQASGKRERLLVAVAAATAPRSMSLGDATLSSS
jgi:hypothetical protein